MFLALTVVTLLPLLQAYYLPPAGHLLLTGSLIYHTDFCQHLSFVEQARRGAVLFVNKYDTRPQPAFVANLEWWAGGRLAALFDRGPVFGIHALGTLATAALLLAAARALLHAGVHEQHFAWSLALFATGGGLGWMRWLQGAPPERVPDLTMAVYPWTQRLIGSAHALVGTALLLWTLVLFAEWSVKRRGKLGFLLCGTALGLTRPLDLLLFEATYVLHFGLDALRGASVRATFGRALEVLWLLPVSIYCVLVFYVHPSFQLYTLQNITGRPPLFDLFMALAPAVALTLRVGPRPPAAAAASLRRSLGLCAAAILALLFFPGGFGLQFVNALGSVLLLLVGMRLPSARAASAATLALLPSSLVALHVFMNPGPGSFARREWVGLFDDLREACRPGDVVYARFGVGALAAALTPCSVSNGHHVLVPDFRARREEEERFFDPASAPGLRRGLVDAAGARFVVVPPESEGWLGPGAPFEVRLRLPVASLLERREQLPKSNANP